MNDPRPLIGEPLSLDLVNTEWFAAGRHHDLLADPTSVADWLAGLGLDIHVSSGTAAAITDRLSKTRAAIRAALQDPADPTAHRALNGILEHGWRVLSLDVDGPRELVQVADETWRIPWLAAADLLELLRAAPERIRPCAHQDCILYFFDQSKQGQRRWCSMRTCGNRLKSRRHYRRTRS